MVVLENHVLMIASNLLNSGRMAVVDVNIDDPNAMKRDRLFLITGRFEQIEDAAVTTQGIMTLCRDHLAVVTVRHLRKIVPAISDLAQVDIYSPKVN